ncbi:Permease of the drug/metabolite transporter (DMT) superfamily [Lachnospiraceae bacterium RM5]|nr:Permease of the drug/metabolite transporter (DMT) superfamily [Lachnospiraceae bacterium RM5]
MDNIFQNKRYKVILAIFCAMGWSLAYPFIKAGYALFMISSDDLGGKLLFAGIRFFLAGVFVTVICKVRGKKLDVKKKSDIFFLVLLAVVNTTLHYMFAYIGLSNNLSSRSTILDSMGGFFLIFLSVIFFEDDKFNIKKVLGCILGISGIVLINIEPNGLIFDNITFKGDGMILLNAVCAGFGGVITRIVSRKMSIALATGYSMTIGGLLLMIAGGCAGIKNPLSFNFEGIVVLGILVMISAVCFAIYNELLAFHPISEIAIYNALIPVLGVFFSALILNEPLKWQYFIAVCLVAVGIWVVNKKDR